MDLGHNTTSADDLRLLVAFLGLQSDSVPGYTEVVSADGGLIVLSMPAARQVLKTDSTVYLCGIIQNSLFRFCWLASEHQIYYYYTAVKFFVLHFVVLFVTKIRAHCSCNSDNKDPLFYLILYTTPV